MRRLIALVLVLVVLAGGCIGSTQTQSSTTSTPQPTGINFAKYPTGKVIGSWWELFNETFYVSDGYEGLVKHYFPNAKVEPFSQFKGSGIVVLSPGDEVSSRILFGKPVQVQKLEPFGYIAYKYGTHLPGPWLGAIAILNSDKGPLMVVTGTSKAGVGASLYFLKELKDRKISVDPNAVVRSGSFEGILLKEFGDVNFNGIPDSDEHYELYQLLYDEPFNYYWRVVKGENVTVSGGFIRLVNGTTVYIRALGFNVTVKVENPKNVQLTYVIENVNPELMVLPEGTKILDNTTIEFTTSEPSFSIVAKNVSEYRVLAFGDHRPASGDKPPEVFLKIMADVNNESGAFVIDGGDLVYSGTIYQWANLMKVWHWNKPVFIAVGNHEYQGEGVSIFHYYFGPTDYAFSLGNYRYIFANDISNDYSLTDEQFAWLKKQFEIAKERGERPVVVMHAPPYDPRPGGDDHAMSEESAKELLKLMKEYNAFGIFSHIHIYWNGTYDGVHFIITGGGGAPLYAKPDEGGFYHYTILTMEPDGKVDIKVVKVST
ncbi:metallophosphoesterase [Thermococcus sp. 21S9]|uniref:metallophosphoesterase family protein n=1 Tax=Thermococcus sp. 21S9 TaxID=1638223 RepID=UPI00143B9A87|nr:metallophosphoesterase [Thermococcus sp. 21S9]NJE54283.1 phosphoesterase [Thermococcus sp. 21S9]